MTNINFIDAIYLQRVNELRLISDVELNGEKLVFSISTNSLNRAREILSTLNVSVPLESQLIDSGLIANVPTEELPAEYNEVVKSLEDVSHRVGEYSLEERNALFEKAMQDRNSLKT